MATIWAREFTGGLDTRRVQEALPGGSLIRATDCHITRGGDVEERAAFVPLHALPAGTVGLANTPTSLVVFGHQAAPGGLPPGVTYQRLQHPDGTTALARVLSWDLYAGQVYAVGLFADGSLHHFYNAVRVADWFDGRARAAFAITNGTAGNQITSIRVGGIEILNVAVSWAGSVAATASAVAAQINSFVSTPDYTAVAIDNTVAIVAAVAGPTPNGLAVQITATGLIQTTPSTLAMANGATTPGTFTPGTFVRTVGERILSVSGANLHGSGLGQPTRWTTDATGAFFIDLSRQTSGAEALASIVEYQDLVAIFGERTIPIYNVDADPANNRKSQVLKNTGTVAARSVTQFGDSDVFYLDESGVRSLRARDSSNAAFTSDIGSAIDPLILDDLATLPAEARANAISLIEPRDGRFWLCIGPKIYVFSYFTATKVSAWSTYLPGFSVEDAIVFRRKVYLRAGNTIYVYGGAGSTLQYDATEPEAWLPYLNADKPTVQKQMYAFDVVGRGEWEVRCGMQPDDSSISDLLGRVTGTTLNHPGQPAIGASTHFSLRFRGKGGGVRPAKIASAVIHFNSSDNED